MTEQELLDIFIQELVYMMLNNLSKTRPMKTPEENERIIQTEQNSDNLSKKRENWYKTLFIIPLLYLLQMNIFYHNKCFLDCIETTVYLLSCNEVYSGLICQDNFSSNLSLGGKHTFP